MHDSILTNNDESNCIVLVNANFSVMQIGKM